VDSALDCLFARHRVAADFSARMDYDSVSIWLANGNMNLRPVEIQDSI
jgi:hypothetical protein